MSTWQIPDTKAGIGEAQVVSGRRIRKIIERFRAQWEADRPTSWTHGGAGNNTRYYGPVRWLHEETGIPERQIHRIATGRQKWVNLSRADAIIQATNAPELLGRDIQVRRNPRWSPERWHAYMSERGCV